MIITLCYMVALLQGSEPTSQPDQEWIRKSAGENVVSLEIVSRRYEAENKPNLWLVGVAHIADETFYAEVDSLLRDMDIVLYESVRPTGSRPPKGETDEERVESTKLSMQFIADVAKKSAEEHGVFPHTMEDVISSASLVDRRLAGWIEDASVDPWGRPFALQIDTEENTVTFWCFGSDGKVGGEGSAADLTVKRTLVISDDLIEEEKEQGMQEDMAEVLGLAFQLDSLSYESPNWFCSDLTLGEVEAKLAERGADPEILKAITGEAFTAKIASGMMKLLPLLDMLVGGGVRETARLLMIEILTMPDVDKMMDGIDPELMNVIIIDRNTEVLSDIAATIKVADQVSTIGVLYGAGHMEDLATRLHTLFGYTPVEERWIVSMSVDPNDSMLDESDMRRMRFMLRYQMHKANQ